MLRIDGLAKRYKTGDHALKGVTFEVNAGQVLGLIGPSGAGKSTLIRCVNRLVEPTDGKVSLNGEPVTGIGGRGLQALFQIPHGRPGIELGARLFHVDQWNGGDAPRAAIGQVP